MCIFLIRSIESEDGPVSNPGTSNIRKLTFGHNNGEALADILLTDAFSQLNYLNLRRTKISPAALAKLAPLLAKKQGGIGTLVLDGIKLANTGVFETLIGQCTNGFCKITVLLTI